MEINLMLGFSFVLIAGLFSGAFALPMKFTSKWQWENVWLMFSIWALLISPWIVAIFTVTDLFSVYRAAPTNELLLVLLFGLIWGVGGITFGKGLDYLGLALGMAIMMGLITAIGTLVPIFVLNPEIIGTSKGNRLFLGVFVLIIGIIILAYAGKMRETDKGNKSSNNPNSKLFIKGLIIAIIAGVFGPMINFAFVFGDEIQLIAEQTGTTKQNVGNTIWPLTFLGGGLVNVGYCIFLLKKNESYKLFKNSTNLYWISTILMGIIWFGSIMFYGMAASNLGELGKSIGWASFQSVAIITSNVIGLLSGEWEKANKNTKLTLFIGIISLIIGIFIIGLQN